MHLILSCVHVSNALTGTVCHYPQFFGLLATIPPLTTAIHRNSFLAIKLVFWTQNTTHTDMRLLPGLHPGPGWEGEHPPDLSWLEERKREGGKG